ncbi:MAG: hypothetical protein ACXWQQ_16625, partial [Pseudobdellovibrio sp.]
MIIKTKKNWKELCDNNGKHESGYTRRQFLERGIATGFMSVALSNLVAGEFIKKAMAADVVCPTPMLSLGAIAQIFSEGGPTMGARFISEQQAALMNAGMASNYGISGQANLMKLGPNMVIDKTSPFGFTILQGPPGYPGGAAAWQTNVLSKISGGGHLGPFNQDDGAGDNTGLVAGVSPFRASKMGKDLNVNVDRASATWAEGLPSASVSSATTANLAKTFSLTPAATGLTNTAAMTSASTAANSIVSALSGVLKNSTRKGADIVQTSAGCAFYGNSVLADPNYGTTLFNPAGITALTSKVTVANLTTAEQGSLAAYYQSAMGVAGGVIQQFGGRDYHGNDPQTDIAPKDIEEARSIVMFLAACDAAKAPGAMIYLANGQAIASGTTAVTATINGANANLNAPTASGDAGGSYNAGLVIFYNPNGAPVQSRFTGKIDATSGNAKSDAGVASSQEAVA